MQRVCASWMFAALALSACGEDPIPGKEWVRFNGEGDTVEVDVTEGTALGPAVTGSLSSTTGEATVGTVTIDPGAGPVGTRHRVTLRIDDAYEARVQRVEFIADAGDRGEWLIAMEQDSADLGIWVRDVTSYGIEGEVRKDVFTFQLFEAVEVLTVPDDGTTPL